MNASSLGAITSVIEASSSLEASLKESQGALHQQRLQRLALQDEVSALSSYAAAVPLLEHEVLAQGDRADALEEVLRVVVAKNEALQAFAHLRVRARSGLQGAEGLRCLAACLADLAMQRAFGLWRWRLPAHSKLGGAETDGLSAPACGSNYASGYASGFHNSRLDQLALQQAEERLEALGRREAALAYDNMRRRQSHKRWPCRSCASAASRAPRLAHPAHLASPHCLRSRRRLMQRTQRVAAVQAKRSAAAASLVVWWRHRQSWVRHSLSQGRTDSEPEVNPGLNPDSNCGPGHVACGLGLRFVGRV